MGKFYSKSSAIYGSHLWSNASIQTYSYYDQDGWPNDEWDIYLMQRDYLAAGISGAMVMGSPTRHLRVVEWCGVAIGSRHRALFCTWNVPGPVFFLWIQWLGPCVVAILVHAPVINYRVKWKPNHTPTIQDWEVKSRVPICSKETTQE